MANATETGPGIADLEKLAAEVDGGDYEARVVAHAGGGRLCMCRTGGRGRCRTCTNS